MFKTKEIPKRDTAREDRQRQEKIVKRLSMGSIPLQNGNIVSEKDFLEKKKRLSQYKFSD